MLPWTQRPPEASLFDPAYCAVLLRQAVNGYQKTALRGLDNAALMVSPVVLHQATRDLLPGTIATKLHFWASGSDKGLMSFPYSSLPRGRTTSWSYNVY